MFDEHNILHCACNGRLPDSTETIQLFLDAGANPSSPDENGNTALQIIPWKIHYGSYYHDGCARSDISQCRSLSQWRSLCKYMAKKSCHHSAIGEDRTTDCKLLVVRLSHTISYILLFVFRNVGRLTSLVERIPMSGGRYGFGINGNDEGDRLARFSTATPVFDVNKEKAVYKTVTLLIEMFDKLNPSEFKQFQQRLSEHTGVHTQNTN